MNTIKSGLDQPTTIDPQSRVRVVWVWTSAILAIILFSFIWFVFGIVLMPIIDLVAASYVFDAQWLTVVVFIKNIILYLPIIMMIGLTIWGALNSSRRDAVQGWE